MGESLCRPAVSGSLSALEMVSLPIRKKSCAPSLILTFVIFINPPTNTSYRSLG